MRQPSTASAPGSSSRAPAFGGTPGPSSPAPAFGGTPGPSATETVARPEPGLARGAWEAPPWVFWTLLGAVAAFATLYLLFRLGVLRVRNRDTSR